MPSKPEGQVITVERRYFHGLWLLCRRCWIVRPDGRPTMDEVLSAMLSLDSPCSQPISGAEVLLGLAVLSAGLMAISSWIEFFITTIWSPWLAPSDLITTLYLSWNKHLLTTAFGIRALGATIVIAGVTFFIIDFIRNLIKCSPHSQQTWSVHTLSSATIISLVISFFRRLLGMDPLIVQRGGPIVNLDFASAAIVSMALWTIYLLVPYSLFPHLRTKSSSGARSRATTMPYTPATAAQLLHETITFTADSWNLDIVVPSSYFRLSFVLLCAILLAPLIKLELRLWLMMAVKMWAVLMITVRMWAIWMTPFIVTYDGSESFWDHPSAEVFHFCGLCAIITQVVFYLYVFPVVRWLVRRVQREDIGASYPVAFFLRYLLLYIANLSALYSILISILLQFRVSERKLKLWNPYLGLLLLDYHRLTVAAASFFDMAHLYFLN